MSSGPGAEAPNRSIDTVASTHRSHAAVLALVDRAQAGDAGAFAQLYDLHWHLIHTYFRYHLNGPVGERTELADDLTANVFVKALEKLPSYRPSGAPFSAWLYRIAHNHLIDTVRAQKRRPGVSLDASDEFAGLEDPEAAQHLDAALAHQQIAEALAALTADQHEVIVHRFMHDRTITETARRMAKHPDAVKQLQLRALQRMRRALGAP